MPLIVNNLHFPSANYNRQYFAPVVARNLNIIMNCLYFWFVCWLYVHLIFENKLCSLKPKTKMYEKK